MGQSSSGMHLQMTEGVLQHIYRPILTDCLWLQTKAERRLCIAKLDVDGDGSVDLKEFVERMAAIR